MINVFQPCVGCEELAAIRDVFESSWLGAGPRLTEFERAFASFIGVQSGEVVSISSCTEGLFQAIAGLDLGEDDDVVLSTISFVGAAHAIRAARARIVLCDVDPQTLNPTVEHVARALTRRTKAILILHFGGRPGDVTQIADLASSKSITLIEDAACAVGSSVDGRACGTLGDIGVWSFDAMKVLVTGDGGMVWARSPELIDKMRMRARLGLAATGHSRAASGLNWWEVEPILAGRRCYMNDIAAAIGLVQLRRLPTLLQRRAEVAAAYNAGLAAITWLRLPPALDSHSANYFYWIQVDPGIRGTLASHLLKNDIYTTFRYWPIHRMRLYRSSRPYPGADAAADSTLLLPIHAGLSDADICKVIDSLKSFTP
jgi:dTDP-4-amino-4,6-dideoxygalactose transaminase